MSKQLTIRGVPDETAARLKRLSAEQEKSVNATVLDILERALGTAERRRRLESYATWTAADREEFEEALRAQRMIDDELWRHLLTFDRHFEAIPELSATVLPPP